MTEHKDMRRGNVEVRPNPNGTVDEVVVYDPTTGRVLFHLEQMDDGQYWMRAEAGPGLALVVNLFSGTPTPDFRESGKVVTDDSLEVYNDERLPETAIGSMYEWDEWNPEHDGISFYRFGVRYVDESGAVCETWRPTAAEQLKARDELRARFAAVELIEREDLEGP